MHLGSRFSDIINSNFLYEMLNEAIECNMIKNFEEQPSRPCQPTKKVYKIGNILFEFYINAIGRASNHYICIVGSKDEFELFHSVRGWNYSEEELPYHRDKILTFLEAIYNKINKKRELRRQDVKVENARKKKEQIELLNTISVKGLC